MNKVEKVARAMAVADGFNPDAQAAGGPNTFALQAADFDGYALCCYAPTWQSYQRQANLLIAGLAALET